MNKKVIICLALLSLPFSGALAAGRSFHFDLTYVACRMLGLDKDTSRYIAYSDQYVDDYPPTDPLPSDKLREFLQPNVEWDAVALRSMIYVESEYHAFYSKYFLSANTKLPKFITGGVEAVQPDDLVISRTEVLNRIEKARKNAFERIRSTNDKKKQDIIFGVYLHDVQDIVFHSGFGPLLGHISVWEEVDKVVVNKDAAKVALAMTFVEIRKFAELRRQKTEIFSETDINDMIDLSVAGYDRIRYENKVGPSVSNSKGEWSEEKRLFRDNDSFDYAVSASLNNARQNKMLGAFKSVDNPIKEIQGYDAGKLDKDFKKSFETVIKENDTANLRTDENLGGVFKIPSAMESVKPFDDLCEKIPKIALEQLSPEIVSIHKKSPGGIDLSNARLVRVKPGDNTLTLTYEILPSDLGVPRYEHMGTDLVREAFILRYKAQRADWYVDLRPRRMRTIPAVGPNIAGSVVGKVLLEADLKLKELMERLQDPDTETGRDLWEEHTRYVLANGSRLGSTNAAGERVQPREFDGGSYQARIWIEPGSVKVAYAGGSIYLQKPELDVWLEDFLQGSGLKNTESWKGEAMLRIMKARLLPIIRKRVNESPEFAPLRAVYSGIVLADAASASSYRFASIYEQMPLKEIGDGYIDRTQKDYEKLLNKKGTLFVDKREVNVVYGGVNFRKMIAVSATQRPDLINAVQENYWGSFTDKRVSEYPLLNELIEAPKSIADGMKSAAYEGFVPAASGAAPSLAERIFDRLIGVFQKYFHVVLKKTITRYAGDHPAPSIGTNIFRYLSYPLLVVLALSLLYAGYLISKNVPNSAGWIPLGLILSYGLITAYHNEVLNVLSTICWATGMFGLCMLPFLVTRKIKEGVAMFFTYALFFFAMLYWFLNKGTIYDWATVFVPTAAGEIFVLIGIGMLVKYVKKKTAPNPYLAMRRHK